MSWGAKRASRLDGLGGYPFASWVEEVGAVVQQGVDVIRLDVGNPDLPPPAPVVEALCESARRPSDHGYAGYRGIPDLRVAMADYYRRRFGVDLDPQTEILPLIGSKEGIVNLALAFLDLGDLVLVPDPGYAPYRRGAILAGAEVHAFPLRPDLGFLPDLDAIPPAIARRATMMWLNFPNNPTGVTVDLAFLERAVDYARRYDLLLCHDAAYCDICYDAYAAPSLLQVPDAVEVSVEFNSLSKAWNMAGWRVGMAMGNTAALAALAQVKSNVDSGMFRAIQEAAIQALSINPDWVSRRNQVYAARLSTLLAGLERVGIEARRPRAAIYVWARAPESWKSEAYARVLLHRAGVAVAPGSFFGPGGEGYVRISLTAPEARIEEAVHRCCQLNLRSGR